MKTMRDVLRRARDFSTPLLKPLLITVFSIAEAVVIWSLC